MKVPMPPRSLPSLCAGALLALACLQAAPARSQDRLDELPMYGGPESFQRSRSEDPALKAADEQLIAGASARWGSRAQAALAWLQQGYAFYGRGQLGLAMRRFNQAWLLDAANPEVYAGYAAVLHDQDKMCDAMRMMDKVMSMNGPARPGFLPDAARVTTLCAVGDAGMAADARTALYRRAEALYRQAEQTEPDKGYVYYSWATADFWRGDYEGAWRMVARARSHGAAPNAKFLAMLAAKMPEPATR